MKADAIKACVAKLGTDQEPSDAESIAAIGEGVELMLGFLANVERIATALETLAGAVDDNCQPAIAVKAMVEPAPASDD